MDKTLSQEAADEAGFLKDLAVILDGTLEDLRAKEEELVEHIGAEAVEELFEIWSSDNPGKSEWYEFLLRATDRERALLRLWNRLDYLGVLRRDAGRALMHRPLEKKQGSIMQRKGRDA